MSEQPEALLRAQLLEFGHLTQHNADQAAAELRRLYAVNVELLWALGEADKLFKEALPKFDWGASFLDNNAIQLLNDVPIKVSAALRHKTGESK